MLLVEDAAAVSESAASTSRLVNGQSLVVTGLILSSLIEYWGGEALPKCRKVSRDRLRRCFHTSQRLAPGTTRCGGGRAGRLCLVAEAVPSLGCWSPECASTSSSSPQLSRRASSCQSEAVLQHKKGALEDHYQIVEERPTSGLSQLSYFYCENEREWYDPEEYY